MKGSRSVTGEARHGVSPAGSTYVVTEMVRAVAGGPRQYTGRPMGNAHRHLGITLGEWTSFMDDLHQSPTRFQAPQPKRPELDAIAETSKDAIVVASLQAAVGAR